MNTEDKSLVKGGKEMNEREISLAVEMLAYSMFTSINGKEKK